MIASWWTRAPIWVRMLVWIGAWGSFLLAVPYAVWTHPRDPWQVLVGLGGLVGTQIGVRFRDPEFWALTTTDRRRVRDVVRTGQPTQDRRLDRLAAGFLVRQTKGAQFNQNHLRISILTVQMISVIAAARSGQPMWWVAGFPLSVVMLLMLLALRGDPPQARLDRLTTSLRGAP